jgi:ketosteroid isomerase-like protein
MLFCVTTTSRLLFLIATICICINSAFGQKQGPLATVRQNNSVRAAKAADSSALWHIVEEMNRKQIEAFNKRDLLGVARIYADDATIYFPHYQSKHGRKIHGRRAIDKYWLAIEKPKVWELEIVEVGGTRDAIWEIGKSTLTEEFDGKDSTYVGDFVVIWKRQKDGTYRIHTDIYN